MTVTDELAWLDAMQRLLARSHLWRPDQLAETVAVTMAGLGVTATVYVVDHEQRALRAMPVPDRDTPAPLPVDASVPGRVFALVRSIPATGPGEAARWWCPIVNGTDRMGAMDFLLPGGVDPQSKGLRERCEMLAGLVGHLITTCAPRGDYLHQVRRSQPMSPASELMWELLQPLTASRDELTLSAILEPCYDIGGDAYDYAIDGTLARMTILDGVGKGLRAGLGTAVALAAIRAARRAGKDLYGQARAADTALLAEFPDARFVTAFLSELHLDTGMLVYLNAGHPPPLLLRHGATASELTGGGRMPLGLDDPRNEISRRRLQRGDRLLLYSDGITEARDGAGRQFGRDRLVEIVEHHTAAGLPAPETLRRISHAVVEHQNGPPDDDATLLLAEWSPPAARRTVP
ncbi:PP2C family protein-serine/threonine phosphatase [Actinoplanes aureus]|uniref:Serine/threonine-protein phosphatase n=1 Tax=Actinoplanes aureus TaxID=2792083 RepID=A0A931C6F2_9ACTN|nr:PP2C family protein-serine/threonine phosphatase [Actinoplanes aureus]MBG0562232.1 serine/threonine-protein phosphatase [Actinoplanes aureus]